MEIIKYALAHSLAAWVGSSEASDLPKTRPNTPVSVSVSPQRVQGIPSAKIVYKDKKGRLIMRAVPRFYYKDDDGNLVPIENLFDESGLDTSEDEDDDD